MNLNLYLWILKNFHLHLNQKILKLRNQIRKKSQLLSKSNKIHLADQIMTLMETKTCSQTKIKNKKTLK